MAQIHFSNATEVFRLCRIGTLFGLTGLRPASIARRMETSKMRVLAIALVLPLAGCGSSETPANVTEKKVELRGGPMLGPIDLSKPLVAEAARPFWRMGVAPGRITFTDKSGGTPTDFYPVTPQVGGDRAVYSTQTPDGERVTLTLSLVPCGEERRALTAELIIGARRLAGCADRPPESDAGQAENATG
jgi:uncharacterized membrane protein